MGKIVLDEQTIIDAVAGAALGAYVDPDDLDDETGTRTYRDALRYRVEVAIEKRITECLGDRVRQAVDTATIAVSEEAVREYVKGGFPRTNTYGEPIHGGQRVSLAERVGDVLKSRESMSAVKATIEETVKKALKEEFAAEVADARRRFREAVDELLAAKLRECVREAAGLKN